MTTKEVGTNWAKHIDLEGCEELRKDKELMRKVEGHPRLDRTLHESKWDVKRSKSENLREKQ
jgi:hypothetical protein